MLMFPLLLTKLGITTSGDPSPFRSATALEVESVPDVKVIGPEENVPFPLPRKSRVD
jgi:hypothetical protein